MVCNFFEPYNMVVKSLWPRPVQIPGCLPSWLKAYFCLIFAMHVCSFKATVYVVSCRTQVHAVKFSLNLCHLYRCTQSQLLFNNCVSFLDRSAGTPVSAYYLRNALLHLRHMPCNFFVNIFPCFICLLCSYRHRCFVSVV